MATRPPRATYSATPLDEIDVAGLSASRFLLRETRRLPYRDAEGSVNLHLCRQSWAQLGASAGSYTTSVMEKLGAWLRHAERWARLETEKRDSKDCSSMSARLRRRSRRSRRLASAAAPSPDTPPPTCLLDLPTDLLVRALSHCDPADIARVAAVSLLFHASLALEGIRLWAQERGFELPAQPEGEGCAVRWLCFAALLRESNPPARAAADQQHSLFIDGEGRLSSCGCAPHHAAGLLGHGEGVTQLNTPTRLPSTLGGERAVGVSAGAFHSLALTGSGAIWSWGQGGLGALGHGDHQGQLQPKEVEAFADSRVVAVSAGGEHSFALTADAAVWSWGYGLDGRLGHGDNQRQLLPKKIEAFAGQRVVAVSAGGYHSLAITADGAVWSWGGGSNGRLGHGDEQNQLLPKKVEALADQRVVAVSAGWMHSLALTADGALWSWGDGEDGMLGHGDEQHQHLPKKIEAFAGRRVVAVSAGGLHSLALTADGAVWSWGWGGYGKLGHGDPQSQLQPKKVEAFAGQRVLAGLEPITASPSPPTAPSLPGAMAATAA